VVLVSSLPVIVLGFGAALSHLLRAESGEPATAPEVNPEAAPVDRADTVPATRERAPAPVSAPVAESESGGLTNAPPSASRVRAKPDPKRAVKSKSVDPADLFAVELTAGEVPSLRRIRSDMHVGQPKAQQIQAELTALLAERLPVAA
jgi:hypothetical protein